MILRPTQSPLDWREFLAKPDLQWKPGKSAMETAHSWEAQEGLPVPIAELFPSAELLFAIPEFKVALPGGGRESQNDVFALLRDKDGLIVCMVEAKRDEPFGPTLGEWMRDASAGKQQRIAAICDLLGLDLQALDPNLRYQLFHRTASAILTAEKFHTCRAAMIVQSFSSEHRWFKDYLAFIKLFGLTSNINQMTQTELPNSMNIQFGWAACDLTQLRDENEKT